jgi:hypothetical protein
MPADHAALTMLGVGVASFAFHYALNYVYQAIVPTIRRLPTAADRLYAATCLTSVTQAALSGPLAVRAFAELLARPSATTACAAGALNLLTQPASTEGLVACAITLGYFASDSLVLLRRKAELLGPSGGEGAWRLMMVHHLVALPIWSYCMLADAGVAFALQNLTTELTNVLQNAFLYARAVGHRSALGLGVAFTASFVAVRIAQIPWIVRTYFATLVAQDCGLGAARLLALLSVPIPVLLNLYWFQLIVREGLAMVGVLEKKRE